jgi:hypothetical protein
VEAGRAPPGYWPGEIGLGVGSVPPVLVKRHRFLLLSGTAVTGAGPDAVVSTVLGLTQPGSIISLHLGHPGTVAALPAIMRGLARRGLRPVTLTELLSP